MLYTVSLEQIKINQITPFFEDFFFIFSSQYKNRKLCLTFG